MHKQDRSPRTLLMAAAVAAAAAAASQWFAYREPVLSLLILLIAAIAAGLLIYGLAGAAMEHLLGRAAQQRFDQALVLCCIAAAICGGVMAYRYRTKARLAPFEPHIAEYIFEPQAGETRAPIRGKLLVVDKKARSIELRTFGLPEEIRPARPEDVGAVAWIEKTRFVTGSYTDGSDAVQYIWDVALVDRATRATLCTRTFKGSEPPKSKPSGRSGAGSSPEDAVYDFLAGYPRQ